MTPIAFIEGENMKIKTVAMSLVWTYVAITSAYGLTKLGLDTVSEIKYQLQLRNKRR